MIEEEQPVQRLGTFTTTVDGNWIEDATYLGGGYLAVGTYARATSSRSTTGAYSLMFSTGESSSASLTMASISDDLWLLRRQQDA